MLDDMPRVRDLTVLKQSHRRVTRLALVPAIAAVLAAHTAGCGFTADRPPAHTTYDSAGITVVRNIRGAWGPDEGWRLSAGASARIPGETDEYQIHSAWGALRLSDGRIVVANGGSNQLLFFTRDGAFIRAAGGDGSGPGEFRNLEFVWPLRDSIVAYDWIGSRVSIWDGSGIHTRSVPIRSPDGRQVVVRGVFDDGSLLVSAVPRYVAPGAQPGLVQDSAPVLIYDRLGRPADTVGVFPAREAYRLEIDGRITATEPPFARYRAFAVADEWFVFGAAVHNQVRIYGVDGVLRRIIDFPGEPRSVTPADVDVYREQRIRRGRGYGSSRQEVERLIARLEFPELMPAYEAIHVDRGGHIWIEEYDVDPMAARSWHVLSPEGIYLGQVPVPAGFRIFQVGEDYVVGRTFDAFEVEQFALYRLLKP